MSTYFVKKTNIIKIYSRDLLLGLIIDLNTDSFDMETALKYIVNFLIKPRYSTPEDLVKQKIDKFKQKFQADNFIEAALVFEQHCQAIVNDAASQQYSVHLLDMLFSLAYRPTAPNRRMAILQLLPQVRETLPAEVITQEECHKQAYEEYVFDAEMNSAFASAVDASSCDDESDLSEWSASDTETAMDTESSSYTPNSTQCSARTCSSQYTASIVSSIASPRKPVPHRLFNIGNGIVALDRLKEQLQHNWWQYDCTQHHANTESKKLITQFARAFQTFTRTHLQFTSAEIRLFQLQCAGAYTWRNVLYQESLLALCTIDEYCLLREILWMFVAPVTCKCFTLQPYGLIECSKNVTISSCTRLGLCNFLESQFVPFMNMLARIRSFIKNVMLNEDIIITHTLECYVADLNSFIQPILTGIEQCEHRLLQPNDMEIHTLLTLQSALGESFERIRQLYSVHKEMLQIDLEHSSGHIISALILTNLFNACQMATCTKEAHLSLALLLSGMKAFCKILDTWWHNGYLNDDYNEFMLERVEDDLLGDYSARSYLHAANAQQQLPHEVLARLQANRLLELFKQHCLGIADTITLLYNINCRKLLNFEAFDEPSLYEQLLFKLFNYTQPNDCALDADPGQQSPTQENELLSTLPIHDDLLFMCFADAAETNAPRPVNELAELTALDVYNHLQQLQAALPLELVMLHTLEQILEQRATKAHRLFIQLYLQEYCLHEHLENISRIFFLRESYILMSFYEHIFHRMGDADTAVIAFELTEKLQNNLSYYLPNIAELFYVQVESNECITAAGCRKKAYQHIDHVLLCYKLNFELSQLITPDNIASYNALFHFVLKLKWCIHTLDNLQFPQLQRKRAPYARYLLPELIMRRLEQLRLWFMFTIQNLHFHVSACVVPPLAHKLQKQLCKCKTLRQLDATHGQYLAALMRQCFLTADTSQIMLAIGGYFDMIVRMQSIWESCAYYTNNSMALYADECSISSTATELNAESESTLFSEQHVNSDTTVHNAAEPHVTLSCPNFPPQQSLSSESLKTVRMHMARSLTSLSTSMSANTNDEGGMDGMEESSTTSFDSILSQDNWFFIQLLNRDEEQLNRDFANWYDDFVDLLKYEVHVKQNTTLDGLYDIFRAQRD